MFSWFWTWYTFERPNHFLYLLKMGLLYKEIICSKGANSFLTEQAPLRKGLVCSIANRKSQKRSRLWNIAKKVPGVSIHLDWIDLYFTTTQRLYKFSKRNSWKRKRLETIKKVKYNEPSYNDSICSQKTLPLKWNCCCQESFIDRMIHKKDLALFSFPHRASVLGIC